MLAYDVRTGTVSCSDVFITAGEDQAVTDCDESDAMLGVYRTVGIFGIQAASRLGAGQDEAVGSARWPAITVEARGSCCERLFAHAARERRARTDGVGPIAEVELTYKKTRTCVCFSTMRDERNAVASNWTAYGG